MTQEAMKLALDALEYWDVQGKLHQPTEEAITAIKEALAQEQEPVAWVSEDVCEGQLIDGRPRKIWWECEKGVGTAFYTATPQRTWVGLTDEDWKEIEDMPDTFDQGVAWAQAKLKQKNGFAEEKNT